MAIVIIQIVGTENAADEYLCTLMILNRPIFELFFNFLRVIMKISINQIDANNHISTIWTELPTASQHARDLLLGSHLPERPPSCRKLCNFCGIIP